jgi:FtsP/CotA-like multicopper oxidase with cupredoxin domain
VIHVTNNLQHNGTSIHWHGIRQQGSVEYDGVPGVTQCPIAPGKSLTYKFQASQYGTTWYHSHFTFQRGDGLVGPLIINGPSTANYDEDLGTIFLTDWAHRPHSQLWYTIKQGGALALPNTLINGMNTHDCSNSTDENCVGGGKKFTTIFEPGKKYRMRLISSATESHFQFSIDGHSLTVIANDLVPIIPYETDSLLINAAQRYDVIVTASAEPGDYWMRGGFITSCSPNLDPDNFTGIIRYNSSSITNPTTKSNVTARTSCGDEPPSKLVPYLAKDVINIGQVIHGSVSYAIEDYPVWTINSTSLLTDWSKPTVLRIVNNETIWPTDYNVVPIKVGLPIPRMIYTNSEQKTGKFKDEFAVYILQEDSGLGVSHPIHLHGHDFWVIGQDLGIFNASSTKLNLVNPPRRDVAILPGNGFLVIAFEINNPGSWLLHCHITWHTAEGLAMQFVESESEINMGAANLAIFENMCSSWNEYAAGEVYLQDDSGI